MAMTLRDLFGIKYDAAQMDCGHFVCLVLRELFGRDLALPQAHPQGRVGQAALIGRLAAELASEVDEPASGDVALFVQYSNAGRPRYHMGVVLVELGTPWLLHLPVASTSVRQRLADARMHGLQLEGYYRLTPATAAVVGEGADVV